LRQEKKNFFHLAARKAIRGLVNIYSSFLYI
jgi:hypothetical protein